FFSSRRRHTRSKRDWSSDVCSSDLQLGQAPDVVIVPVGGGGLLAGSLAWLSAHCPHTRVIGVEPAGAASMAAAVYAGEPVTLERSEERRVGKEWSRRGAGQHDEGRW